MKYLAFVAAIALAAGVQAQTGSASASTQTQSSAALQGNGAQASAAQTTNVSAELTKKVDTKNAKVGDEITARTTRSAHLNDGTNLPKGTQLLGRVTGVQAKSAEERSSRLAFTFDRAVLRNGNTLPIHATVMSLSAPVSAAAMAENDDSMSAGGPAPVVASGGGRASGGGLLGGGTVRGIGSALGGVASATDNTLHTASGVGGSAVRGTANTASSVTEEVTNLPGVGFSADGNAGESAVLNAQGRNISLANGTQMTLSVSAQKQ
jgi:hypothetical protein